MHRTRGGMVDRARCLAKEIAYWMVINRTQVSEILERKPGLLRDKVADGRRLGQILFLDPDVELEWIISEAARWDPESINVQDHEGRTLLHESVTFDRKSVAKKLLSLRADVEARDKQDHTPFMDAAWRGKVGFVEVLLEHGVDVSSVRSALHITNSAAVAGHLLQARAEANLRDENGRTTLHNVLFRKTPSEELVRLLLERDAEPNAVDLRGRRPLHEAAVRGKYASLELLLAANAEVSAPDNNGDTALHDAKDKVVVNLLVFGRADMTLQNRKQ